MMLMPHFDKIPFSDSFSMPPFAIFSGSNQRLVHGCGRREKVALSQGGHLVTCLKENTFYTRVSGVRFK